MRLARLSAAHGPLTAAAAECAGTSYAVQWMLQLVLKLLLLTITAPLLGTQLLNVGL